MNKELLDDITLDIVTTLNECGYITAEDCDGVYDSIAELFQEYF